MQQLTKQNLICIARHIQQHVEDVKCERATEWPDACEGCKYAVSGTCTDNPNLFDPWPAFRKLNKLTGVSISPLIKRDADHEEHPSKLGNR